MTVMMLDNSLADFEANAKRAADLLKALGNEKRLMILCRLLIAKEMSVMPLAEAVGLSQSALSQHLARMREEGLVDYRRSGQMLFYHITDPNVRRVILVLKSIYC